MKIITDIKGGLGNQLFSYAFGYALSREYDAKLILDVSMLNAGKVNDRKLEIDRFGICCDRIVSVPYSDNILMRKSGMNRLRKRLAIGFGTKLYKEKKECVYDPEAVRPQGSTYYDGYWQSYRYFDKYRQDLLSMIKPKEQPQGAELALMTEMEEPGSVSLHVRRGDYAGMKWLIPMEYYDKAIELIREERKDAKRIYVFSDDMDFVKDHFGGKDYGDLEFKYIEDLPGDRTVGDMMLMSRCRHHIIANSSYSWWGAYLGDAEDKAVICPKTGMWGGDFYMPEWMTIELD